MKATRYGKSHAGPGQDKGLSQEPAGSRQQGRGASLCQNRHWLQSPFRPWSSLPAGLTAAAPWNSPHQPELPRVEWYRDSKLFVSSNMHTFVSVPVAEFRILPPGYHLLSSFLFFALTQHFALTLLVIRCVGCSPLHQLAVLLLNSAFQPGDRVRFHRFQVVTPIDPLQMPVASSRLQGCPQLLSDFATNCRFQWPFFFPRSD